MKRKICSISNLVNEDNTNYNIYNSIGIGKVDNK